MLSELLLKTKIWLNKAVKVRLAGKIGRVESTLSSQRSLTSLLRPTQFLIKFYKKRFVAANKIADWKYKEPLTDLSCPSIWWNFTFYKTPQLRAENCKLLLFRNAFQDNWSLRLELLGRLVETAEMNGLLPSNKSLSCCITISDSTTESWWMLESEMWSDANTIINMSDSQIFE